MAGRILGDQLAVWIYDLVRDTSTRLTFEFDEVGAQFPTWTPDGTRVAFGPPSPGSVPMGSQLIVVQNWLEELKRLVPTN